jgi:O-antigen/teichoic acid export membrane protein
MGDGGFGRVIAYIWAVFVIVNGFLILAVAPWYGAFAIALATLVVYGLASSPRDTA